MKTIYEHYMDSFQTGYSFLRRLLTEKARNIEAVRVDFAFSEDGKWQRHTGHVVFLKEGLKLDLSGDVVKEPTP